MRCGERLLERLHVVRLHEQTERRVDLRVPRVVRDDAVRERADELVALPLRQRPLQVRAVQLAVRVLARRDRALDGIERVLRFGRVKLSDNQS